MRTALRRFRRATVLVLVLACAGTWVWGQTRVNTLGNARSVNTQVNTQLYGPGPSGSVRYAESKASSTPMNSEFRHAYWKSGATPSDLRMGYAALGPMNASGPLAYIPEKPSYLNKPASTTPPPSRPATYSNQSVRYSSTPSASALNSRGVSRPVSSPQVSNTLSSGGAINSAPLNAGPLRYGR